MSGWRRKFNARKTPGAIRAAAASAAASSLLLAHSVTLGQLSVTSDSTYIVDFDSTVAGVNNGTFAGTGFEPGATTVGRLDSNAWAATGWSDGDLPFGGTQTTAVTDYTRGSSSGPVTTNGFWAFSIGGAGRTLGLQQGQADWDPGTLTLRVQNNTGQAISSVDFAYKLYYRNDQGRSTTITLSASQDDSTYTNVAGGSNTSFSTPTSSDALGFRSVAAAATISALSVAPGSYLYLRWNGSSGTGSGARDEIAFDDITLNHFILGSPPNNLVWNSFPSGAWNATPGNQPWLKNGNASAFTSGDNVVFNEPASGTVVSIDAAGVQPTSIVVNNSANAYTFTGGPIHGAATLVKNNAGSVILANPTGWTGGIAINGGTIALAENGSAGGVLKIGGAFTLATSSGAKLDLKNNHLVLTTLVPGTWNGSAYTGAAALIATGRGGSSLPLWDGAGGIITSESTAALGNYTTLAVARASDVRPATATATATWAGQTITGTDTLIMYTYGGDATLDGKINVDDYIRIDSGISAGLTGWSNGDFNYDGKVNIDDYTQFIDANIGIQGAPFVASGGEPDSGGSFSLVPEPGSGVVLLGLGGAMSFRRIRRRRAEIR